MEEYIETAEKILKENLEVKSKEKVGIVSDHPSKIMESFIAACDKLGFDYKVIDIPLERNNSGPIPEVLGDMMDCDALVAPTENSITHSPETTKLRREGKRIITLPGIQDEVFLKIKDTDLEDILETEKKIHEQVKDADKIHVTTPSGTDVTFRIKGREWHLSAPKVTPGNVRNLPTGELFIAPLENSANGKIVIDRWGDITKDKKATIQVKDGKLSDWNDAAQPYVDCLKEGGENGLIIAEFGIGTNKAHKEPLGNTLHDEKIYGTCHIAFGLNTSFGGENEADVHQDVVLQSPAIVADGREIEY